MATIGLVDNLAAAGALRPDLDRWLAGAIADALLDAGPSGGG